MRKLLLALLLALMPLTAFAEELPPLEQLILQQHFTQKELERTLGMIKQEESRLNGEVARLDLDMQRQKLVMEAMKRHAGEVAVAYYTGERVSLLTLLFDAENFNDFLLMFDFLQLLYERDMQKLEKYQAERTKMEAMQSDKLQRITALQELKKSYEKQLAEMLAIQAEKEENLSKIGDATNVQSLIGHLIVDWRERGLPAFQTFFSQLSTVMFQIPELATPDRIQSEGLFLHTLTIRQDEFNQFLMNKDELFKHSQFRFENNQLIVEGTYDHMQIKLVGSYELVSPKELKFRINELYFDGFALPSSTIEEMDQAYDFGFYPELISPNIQVQGISMVNEELKLQLKINFPFGFGQK
ncbi:hypothetical protein NDK47_09755 [Brevibacillus ruminantium]|uniref:Uncharacterized protein n=1 Tax=Brevibacillus ruminantium TaxID=2950604 RepID=A0ABY4WL87_9BACL|nr:hypothetical protein [Brevibacillus ruminantium]USG67531.1 hypothetical protein NDK47_09755 [Brevibacillus ruminantium]